MHQQHWHYQTWHTLELERVDPPPCADIEEDSCMLEEDSAVDIVIPPC